MVIALLAAALAQDSGFADFTFAAASTSGAVRDGVRAWNRTSLGFGGDLRFTALLLGSDTVRFGPGGSLFAILGGQWSQEEVDGTWATVGADLTAAAAYLGDERTFALELGVSYRRDRALDESIIRGGYHARPWLVRASVVGERRSIQVDWATGRHLGVRVGLRRDERWGWTVGAEYARYGFRPEQERVFSMEGSQGLSLTFGLSYDGYDG